MERRHLCIREPRALELANLVNMIIFDARVLDHPSASLHAAGIIYAMRLMPWSSADTPAPPPGIFVMATSEDQGHRLADDLGLDGYFIEAEGGRRAELVEGFQSGGRTVCYVGGGVQDAAVMKTALESECCRCGNGNKPCRQDTTAIKLRLAAYGFVGAAPSRR